MAERKLSGLCLDCGLSESVPVEDHNILCNTRMAKEDEKYNHDRKSLQGRTFTYAIQEWSKEIERDRVSVLAARMASNVIKWIK